MRILFYGNVCNYAYWFARWSRDCGVDAHALIEKGELYQPELDVDDYSTATAPAWVHYYDPPSTNDVIRCGGVDAQVSSLLAAAENVHAFSVTAAIGAHSMGSDFRFHNVGSFGRSVSWLRFQSPRSAIAVRRIALAWRFRRAMRHASTIIASLNTDQFEVLASPFASKLVTLAFPYDFTLADELCASARGAIGQAEVTTFLMPARQHWHSKGQDLVFEAIALLPASVRAKSRFVALEWGADLQRSKRRIDELGLEALFTWLPMQRKRDLYALMLRPRTVTIADFYRDGRDGGHGGVSRDAMAVGCPLIAHTGAEADLTVHRSAAPLLHASCAPAAIAEQLRNAVDMDDAALQDVGRRLREWLRQENDSRVLIPRYLELHGIRVRGS